MASTVTASRLAIKMIGRIGPRPPLAAEPVSAWNTELAGEDPSPCGAAALEPFLASVPRRPWLWVLGRTPLGAVDWMNAAAARPVDPCESSARCVDDEIAPVPPGPPPDVGEPPPP